MAKGIAAFVIVTALVMSISILAGLGFYEAYGVDYEDSANSDVNAAADALIGQEATDRTGGSVLQDFTTSAGTTLSSAWQVISNLSGILQLLFGLPSILTETIEKFFQLVFGITFAAFIRGVVF